MNVKAYNEEFVKKHIAECPASFDEEALIRTYARSALRDPVLHDYRVFIVKAVMNLSEEFNIPDFRGLKEAKDLVIEELSLLESY